MGKLTIQEIAKILVEKNKLTPKEANQFAAVMFEIVQQQLDKEELVKIKGLGTFKMIRVEARESVSVRTGERVMIDSHAKITFTPDAAMKELVNKPFSQFETVVLNEGVEFDDLQEEEPEESVASEESNIVEESSVVETPPTTIESQVDETIEEDEPAFEDESPSDDDEDEVEDEESESEDDGEETVFVDEEGEEESGSWKKPLCYGLLTLVLMAASAYGGYWYGLQTAMPAVKAPVEVDTAPIVVPTDSIKEVLVDSVDMVSEEVAAAEKQQPTSEAKEEQPNEEEPFWKKYEAMDARVRTGAYHIIGTDHEVKVRKGETLSRIARRELGEGMSCYIEVYNDLKANSELQEGQVIKIPKLKWKVKR